jgi:hypothetical protein
MLGNRLATLDIPGETCRGPTVAFPLAAVPAVALFAADRADKSCAAFDRNGICGDDPSLLSWNVGTKLNSRSGESSLIISSCAGEERVLGYGTL